MSIDPSNGRIDLLSLAQPSVRVRQRVVSRRLRRQGVHLGELSNRRRAARDSTGLHLPAVVDDAGVWTAFQTRRFTRLAISTGSMDGTNPTRRSRVLMRNRQSRVARNSRMDGDDRGRRPAQPHASGPIEDRCWPSMASSCVSASWDTCCGSTSVRRDTKRFRGRGCFRARVVGLPVLSRGLLYVVQNTRDTLTGARPRLLCYDLRA